MASAVFPGVGIDGRKIPILIIAAIVFSLANYAIKPLIVILSLPVIVITMGFFTFVINTLMLYLTSFFVRGLDIKNIRSAIGAVVMIWIVNFFINWLSGTNIREETV